MSQTRPPHFVTLGMFIIDEFSFLDQGGLPTGQIVDPQIGGGGTYAAIGARIWLPTNEVGMIVDKGQDFPTNIYERLQSYGTDMWTFRDQPGSATTRALNSYRGDHRDFHYITPRIRITPHDLATTRLARASNLHFVCSPSRALVITSEIAEVEGWRPLTIYEPIPDRCVPEELPKLIEVLPFISILSPNAEEALSLMRLNVTKPDIETAAERFLDFGIGGGGGGHVIIRSGAMGSFVKCRGTEGRWIDAFWDGGADKVVDVTGAGNAYLGGLAAGLKLAAGDVFEAALYGTVSASFIIEQQGLPSLFQDEGDGIAHWNGDDPRERLWSLKNLRKR